MTLATRALLDQRYTITHLLSERANERQYAARHVELALPVHIIAIRSRTRDNQASAHFWSMVTQASRVRHPALARVRDSFRQGEQHCVVVDDVAGETLAARLQHKERLSLREALAAALQLCDALDTMSRVSPALLPLTSITPDTLTLTRSGQVVLTDLGWERWLSTPAGTSGAHCDIAAYQGYSAPEIIGGQPADVRADVYSIAAVLYASLTGQAPAIDAAQRVYLPTIEPFVPAAIGDIIEQALHTDPARRFATPSAFGEALGRALYESLPALVALVTSPYVSPVPQHILPPEPDITLHHPRAQVKGVPLAHHTHHSGTYSCIMHWPRLWARSVHCIAEHHPRFKHTGERAISTITSAFRLNN